MTVLLRITLAAVLLCIFKAAAWAAPGVDATAIRLSADSQLTGVWIDGQSTPLLAHAGDWSHADNYGPRTNLHCLAASAQAGTDLGHIGFIGAVVLKDGRWVVTDDTWRAWPGPTAPPPDAQGRAWTDPDYDDRAWKFATDIGPYGTGPWGSKTEPGSKEVGTHLSAPMNKTDKLFEASPAASSLDQAMRLSVTPMHPITPEMYIPEGVSLPAGTDITSFMRLGPSVSRLWNADWIWAGPPLGGATIAYFRKDFSHGAGIPPSTPQNLHATSVTPSGFTLAWQPSFSAQGSVTYEVAWNGQVMTTTAGESATLDGLTINPTPQNYAWVRAIAPDGTRSRSSAFVLLATPSTDVPEAPQHLRIIARGAHGVSVAWDPAADTGLLDHYNLVVGSMYCYVPPGVCSVTVDDASFIKPSSPISAEISAQGESGKTGPSATVESWTLPEIPVQLWPPTSLREEAGHVRWHPVNGATAYRIWRDGTLLPETIATTEIPIPAGESNGFLQVDAIDGKGNISAKSQALLIGHPVAPTAPVLRDGGRSGHTIVLRWTRPAAGTCIGYRVEMNAGAGWTALATLNDPWQDEYVVGRKETFQTSMHDSLPAADPQAGPQLEPGTSNLFRVVALPPDAKEVASDPLALTTVAPSLHPALRFAVILATDGRYDYLDRSLSDAEAANCAFALLKGQLVPQISHDPKQWNQLVATLHKHHIPAVLSLLGSKDGWSEINDVENAGPQGIPIIGRYDMGPWRTGQPFDQLHTELNGALQMAAVLENPLGNPAFLPDLEQWSAQADTGDACRWFFSSGVSTESAPGGIPDIILQLHRPEVDFMRMINGDRGHELALDSGSNVACASPQRNRVGAHYIISVEDKRLVFESRQLDKKTNAFSTDDFQEIIYDRAANHIAASNLRVPYPFGIATGLPIRADHQPPWTQNRIATCAPGGQTGIQLLGHSASTTPLKFTVTRQPQHGTLTGTGDHLIYQATPHFQGDDVFLYRCDDAGPWPSNTAWVRITVGAEDK